jgi:hypothetical protein
MGRADDVVRRREEDQARRRAATREREAANRTARETELRKQIRQAIPPVMRMLERLDYPDAEMHKIIRDKSWLARLNIFGSPANTKIVEMAAWRVAAYSDPLDEEQWHVGTVWLLSDGTIENLDFLELPQLEAALTGLEALDERLADRLNE